MPQVPVEIVVQSHLSDLVEFGENFHREERLTRLKFVKYLIHHYRMEDQIDAEKVFETFLKQK